MSQAELQAALHGRYEIERELGAGGMALVYVARDLQRDRRVALKALRPELGMGAIAAERFLREIRLTARLVHPHILPLLDSGDADGRLWYAMPLIEEESLRGRLEREGRLPVEEALQLTGEVADALAYAHEQGILHRDIKPENILLSGGHALVSDLGIARAIREGVGERITSAGMAVGTPAYMSPEQAAADRALDPRSDLYSLACVTHEMLVGQPPFVGATTQAMLARRLNQPLPSLRVDRPEIPESVELALRRALAPERADRFATVPEFARALTGAAPIAQAAPDQPKKPWWRRK